MLSEYLNLGNKLNYYGLIIIPFINFLVFYIGDLYKDVDVHRKREMIAKLTICCIFLFFILSGIKFVFENFVMNFKYYVFFCFISTSLIIFVRTIYYKILNLKNIKNRLLIIGYSEIVKNIYKEIDTYNSIMILLVYYVTIL
jgi:FlaA1/EpsC-like NDP-sugar epimerase